MVGRRNPQDEGHTLAIRTDFKGKGVAHDDGRGRLIGGGSNGVDAGARAHNERFTTRSPTASLSSISTLGDDQVNTHLSASSAGNTDTLSSSGISGRSTARTSTMTDDDRPSASTPASPSPHAHPTLTVLQLVSNSASSSALPDSFDFSVSRKGNFAAVFSASNIWLIKTAQLPRLWARTLQVKRKPIAIDITEDGFLLAVLSRPTQVDIYEIHGEQDEQIKKRRSIGLVHEATTTVISPDARILITGNKFGIEVIAIGPDAPETARRALSGPVGDSLEFADDGRTLLITGCARKSESSSLYVLPGLYDGPMDEEGVPIPVAPETIWTTSVLFPETARIARQATLLPDADTGHVSELFAFNAEEDTWGIYDIACQRFTQRKMFLPDHQRWTRSEFIDDAMPAVSPNADLAAVALRMRGTTSIWIYEVPGWECKPSEKQSPIQPCFCIPILKDGADVSQEISALRWVRINSKVQRLVAVGNATMPADDNADPGAPVGSKGVIIVLDFDKSKPAGSPVSPPTKTEYDLDPLCPGEILPEGNISFESEVELVRTRTIAQRRIQDRAAGARRNSRLGSQPARSRTSANSSNRHPPRPAPPPAPADDEEELTFEEAQAAFEAPYDNQQPRSQMSLARAATVAAVSPANRRHLRALPFRPLEYRRADGLREFPHESDADNWVPPPPVYTATAEASQSISLSHPNAPPVPRKPSNGGRSVSASHASPPVPLTSATVSPTQIVSTNPYLARGQSASSTDLTHPQPHERRPSLLHPSTYPAPQSPPTTRRRSSTAHGPPQQVPTVAPNTQIQNQSAYQATQSLISTARRPLRPRRGVESTVDLRPPPLVDPGTLRRGSEPEVLSHGHGRSQSAQSANVGTNRNRLLNGLSTSGHAQRSTLPRLVTQGDATTRRGPMTAPPRSDTIGRGPPPRAESRAESRLGMGSRLGMRSGVRESYNERREKEHGKKPMKCIVM